MPFEKITVRLLCQEAQVSKFTFYNYYCDKYELARSIQDEFIGGLCDTIESYDLSEEGSTQRDRDTYEYISARAVEYRALTTLTLEGINFNQRLLQALQRLTRKQIDDGVKRSGRTCTEEAALFFSHTIASNEMALIEIITNGLIERDRLKKYQRAAGELNEMLMEKIRRY